VSPLILVRMPSPLCAFWAIVRLWWRAAATLWNLPCVFAIQAFLSFSFAEPRCDSRGGLGAVHEPPAVRLGRALCLLQAAAAEYASEAVRMLLCHVLILRN
jgi:hypothetical protein